MCFIHLYEYIDCHHYQKEIVTPCRAGFDEEAECCNNGSYQGMTTYLYEPSYCPHCYRSVEAWICDEYNEKTRIIQNEIVALQGLRKMSKKVHQDEIKFLNGAALEAAETNFAEADAELEAWAKNAETNARNNRALRSYELRTFREFQGVWGDG